MIAGRRIALLLLLPLAAAPGCGGSRPAPAASSNRVTFTRDIAPIVFGSCAPCHRAGGPAPFRLQTYADVFARARQIEQVVSRRYMPPWLPEPAEPPFAGERRLSDEQIERIRSWYREGAIEGDPADLQQPPPPWSEGWQLGQPALVLELPETYVLAADGLDTFRNFVIPIPIETTRWVRALELQPGNKRIVHHAILQVDRTPSSRRLDADDPGVGFAGMDLGQSLPPDGHFLGWTPGKRPYAGDAEMAWRLEPGADLVLQLHMLPTGKPEPIRPLVGLYFADRPPTKHPTVVRLSLENLDIPAGAKDYTREDSFELPVATEVLAVYPHAHYLGREILGYATLPDGGRRTLIHIKDWNFNWQDDYRFVEPLPLPAGTRLTMHYTYDNSAGNPRNPHHPPRRVTSGTRSSDEMGSLTLQLLTRSDDERARLEEAKARDWLESFPDAFPEHNNLGNALLAQGRAEEALVHYRQALALEPGLDDARYNGGIALAALGRHDEAIVQYRQLLARNPDYAKAYNNLGNELLRRGRRDEAIGHFRRAIERWPSLSEAHYNLGIALADEGRYDEAIAQYRATLELDPHFALAYSNLGTVYHQQGRLDLAIEQYQRALALEPGSKEGHNNLGLALAAQGRREEALAHFREALRIDPDFELARENLRDLLRRGSE